MGLKDNANGSVKYVRIKDGKFYLNTDLEKSYDELEGLLTGIRFKDDEFKGEKIRKVNFGLTDAEDGSTYIVGVTLDSSYCSTLVSFLKNADLSKPLTFHPKINKYKKEDGTEGERRSILVSQDGVFLKSFYSKESGNKLPDFKKVIVNKKTVYDKADFLDALESIITNEFLPKLSKQPIVTEAKPKAVVKETPTVEEEFDDVSSDGKLPWDE